MTAQIMKVKKRIICSILIILVIITGVIIYRHIGPGAREKKAAESFVINLIENDIINLKEEGNKKYTSIKKSDPLKKEEYYNVTVGDYAIDVDAKYNVIGFTNQSAKDLNIAISKEEAVDIGKSYLEKIYTGDYKFKEVLKEEEIQVVPYYTLIFTKYKAGYPYYNCNLSLKINKQTGKLDGYSNASIGREAEEVLINISEEEAKNIAKQSFSLMNTFEEVEGDIEKAYVESQENSKIELCYIIIIKGRDEENKEVKMQYCISTDSGEIVYSEKSNITSTIS
ncbi:MAG: hypothetical protein E7214_07220 [Clostridium sp.]|nr:hypothetical protein [Clostridium sp.]